MVLLVEVPTNDWCRRVKFSIRFYFIYRAAVVEVFFKRPQIVTRSGGSGGGGAGQGGGYHQEVLEILHLEVHLKETMVERVLNSNTSTNYGVWWWRCRGAAGSDSWWYKYLVAMVVQENLMIFLASVQ
jgi:hypothetical protein